MSALMPQVDLLSLWRPYAKQHAYITNTSLFSFFLAGVGSGKSHALACWVIYRALRNPGSVGALLGRTSNDLAAVLLPNLFDRLEDLQRATGVNLIRDYDKGNAKLTLINGTTILFRPYNRIQKLRGLTLAFAGCDEVEFAECDSEELWSVLTGRLRGTAAMPGLGFASSPNGLRGITKRFVDAQMRYADAVARGDEQAMREASQYHVTTATSFDNPYLPPHFHDSLKSMSKRRYEQEALGKVLRPLNTVYSLEPRHFIEFDLSKNMHLPRVIGVDWGTQSHHVAVEYRILSDGRWVAARELVDDDNPRGRFLDSLIQWIDKGGDAPKMIGADRACPVENGALQRRYLRTSVMTLQSKDAQKVSSGIESIRDALDPVNNKPLLLFSKQLPVISTGITASLVPAMRGYRYALDHMGQPTQNPMKDNVNDHMCDQLRYAWIPSMGRPDLHGGRLLLTPDVGGTSRGPGNSGSQT